MSTRPPSDDTLERRAIARAGAGDWDAVHFLYALYADDVAEYVRGMVGDRAATEEITHALFARLSGLLAGYPEADGEFATWLFGLAREAAREHLLAAGEPPPKRFARRDGRVRSPAGAR